MHGGRSQDQQGTVAPTTDTRAIDMSTTAAIAAAAAAGVAVIAWHLTRSKQAPVQHLREGATNVHWHAGAVSRDQRWRALGQKGAVVWLTGLSGSGKSTIACAVEQILLSRGRVAYILDGDNLRHGLNSDLGFSGVPIPASRILPTPPMPSSSATAASVSPCVGADRTSLVWRRRRPR